jgi:hypothetical protein
VSPPKFILEQGFTGSLQISNAVTRGNRLKGRTPAQALKEALGISGIPELIPSQEVSDTLQNAA